MEIRECVSGVIRGGIGQTRGLVAEMRRTVESFRSVRVTEIRNLATDPFHVTVLPTGFLDCVVHITPDCEQRRGDLGLRQGAPA